MCRFSISSYRSQRRRLHTRPTEKHSMHTYTYLVLRVMTPKFTAIIHGELHRLRRTNKLQSYFHKHAAFLKSKLVARGYSVDEFDRVYEKFKHPQLKMNKTGVRKVFLKVPYSSAIPASALKRAVAKHSHLLGSIRTSVAFTVQKNMFRLHFGQNWRHARPNA